MPREDCEPPPRTCAKLPPPRLGNSLVQLSEECKKNARQNVLLGELGAIIDNSRQREHCRLQGPAFGGASYSFPILSVQARSGCEFKG